MKNNGFTLVELLVVIAIIGVIMAYAVPAYNRNVIIAKRSEAKSSLMELASAQERNNAIYNQYATNLGGTVASAADLGFDNAQFMSSVDYDYSVGAANGYTLTATAKGNTQVNDNFGVDCTTMTLNSLGQKTPLDCWQ